MAALILAANFGSAMAGGLLPEIESALARLGELDRPYRLYPVTVEAERPADRRLFHGLPATPPPHPSYEATFEFCRRFDPWDEDDDEVPDREILAYLRTLVDMAPIREAFRVTGRARVEDLMRIWFRRGRGFEHVICGESGGQREGVERLGGYHFWYVHLRHEELGRAFYDGADYGRSGNAEGMADPGIVTGHLSWDVDGDGPRPPLRKQPVGGFTVGNSVAAMLAAGHIAFYGARRNPIDVDMNGKLYPWTFHRKWSDRASSIRSLWPRFVPGESRFREGMP